MLRGIPDVVSHAALCGLLGCLLSVTVDAAQPGSPSLETVEVSEQPLVEEQVFDGVVEALFRSTVSAQTSGEIVELPFDVNDFVPKGSVVLRIDDTRQKAERDKAAADEAKARARLREAALTYQRNKRLIKEHAVSKAQLDKSEADLKSARAQVELTAAALEQAREQLEYTKVRAPYDGVLVERFVELNEQVQVGTRLVTGLSLEKLRVKVEVPAHYAERVRKDAAARVALPHGRWIDSDQITFFPYADPVSHTFTARVQLPQGRYGLYPGMLVKVAFRVGEKPYLAIPSQAVVHRSEVTGVYVVGDDQALQFRQLRVGATTPATGQPSFAAWHMRWK